MNKEEAIEQLYRLSLDWEENGLDTKLNQTDINAIGMVISELEIANKKLEDLKEHLENSKFYYKDEDSEEIYEEVLENKFNGVGGVIKKYVIVIFGANMGFYIKEIIYDTEEEATIAYSMLLRENEMHREDILLTIRYCPSC